MIDRASIRVPATGANLGCLFDCGAVALSLYLDIRATMREDHEVVVHYRGVNAERVSMGAENLIARTMRETLRGWGKTHGFELEIENQIPVGAGVGSSAAAKFVSAEPCRLCSPRTVWPWRWRTDNRFSAAFAA